MGHLGSFIPPQIIIVARGVAGSEPLTGLRRIPCASLPDLGHLSTPGSLCPFIKINWNTVNLERERRGEGEVVAKDCSRYNHQVREWRLDRKNKYPRLSKIYMEKSILLVHEKGRSKDFIKSVASEINLKGWVKGKKGKAIFS